MIIGARRAADARDSIQFGDLVKFRPGPLSRRVHQGRVTGWERGALVVACTDGVNRRVGPGRAEKVGW